jgi:hypothetical protein
MFTLASNAYDAGQAVGFAFGIILVITVIVLIFKAASNSHASNIAQAIENERNRRDELDRLPPPPPSA